MNILVLLVAFFTPALSQPDLPSPSLALTETAQNEAVILAVFE